MKVLFNDRHARVSTPPTCDICAHVERQLSWPKNWSRQYKLPTKARQVAVGWPTFKFDLRRIVAAEAPRE